jgi:5'-3' exonuclease
MTGVLGMPLTSSQVAVIPDERKREWKTLLRIPFVDERRLLAAFADISLDSLSPEEMNRNAFGAAWLFRREASTRPLSISLPLRAVDPWLFVVIHDCHVRAGIAGCRRFLCCR